MSNLEPYLNLPYTVVLCRNEDAEYVARIEELAGLTARGRTAPEALESLEQAKKIWIADRLGRGKLVPPPRAQEKKERAEEAMPSGKWLQRVPRTLHRDLIRLAQREQVSLNQLVTSLLSEALGARRPRVVSRRAAPHGGMLTPRRS